MSQKTNDLQENIMGTMGIHKLFLTISLPMVLSMLIQSMYNIVDSYFVAKISEDALSAVSLAFPVQQVMIAVSTGTGVGFNALLSRKLGEKDRESVNSSAMNGVFLAFVSSFVFVIFGIFFAGIYMNGQTDVESIVEGGTQYLAIVTILSMGGFGEITFSRLLQSTGKTVYSMIGQIVGAVTNIILDPILIFGLCGFPALGIAGAAYATVIGQFFGAGLDIFFNMKFNHEIEFKFKKFRPDMAVIREIYVVGVPAIINNSIFAIMVFSLNKILLVFSTAATAVMGVYFKVQSFIFMPIFGFTNATIPIISYNYGARHKERIVGTLKYSILYTGSIGLLGSFLLMFFAEPMLTMFLTESTSIEMGIAAFKVISISIVPAVVSIILGCLFQALRRANYSLITHLMRQCIILLPIAYFLSLTGNVNNVWWSFVISDICGFLIACGFYSRVKKKVLDTL